MAVDWLMSLLLLLMKKQSSDVRFICVDGGALSGNRCEGDTDGGPVSVSLTIDCISVIQAVPETYHAIQYDAIVN